jgi:hypothetical protein
MAGTREFSFVPSFQTGSRVHPAFYSIGIVGSFPGNNVVCGVKLSTSSTMVKVDKFLPLVFMKSLRWTCNFMEKH